MQACFISQANCGHSVSIYIEGVSTRRKVGTKDPSGYERRQKQKYAARMVNKWSKRKAVAINPEEERLSKAKLTEWRAEVRRLKEMRE